MMFRISFLFLLVHFGLFLPTNGTIAMDLQEELPAGTLIFNLRERLQMPLAAFSNSRFQYVDQSLSLNENTRQAGTSWIAVDSRSGDVRQKDKVDREILCGRSSNCYIVVELLVHSQSSVRTETINFYITDINDNVPVFPSSVIDLSVPETSPVGHEISLDKTQATDPDKGENSTITYSLSPPSEYFSVRQSVDENQYHHLQLVIEKELDFETDKIHRLTLRASDGGSPPLSTAINIQVSVEDENDNAPEFEKKRYSVNLREDSPTGTHIAVVHAADVDAGTRGNVRYFIRDNMANTGSYDEASARPISSRRYPVTVNELTGAVILRDKLDHKLHDNLKIFIEAVDGDEEDPKIGRTLLVLHVEDVNDNAPSITVNFITYNRGNTGYVSESATIGSFLAHVTATDADEGLNGDITLSAETITSSTGNGQENFTETGKFLITEEDNLLVTGIKFDREKLDRYDVIIKAVDKGVPPKSSTAAITIVILDENEFAPKFLHSDLVFDLPENQEVGSVVGRARATDEDNKNGPSWRLSENEKIERSQNGKITYGLTLAEIGDDTDNVKPVRIAPDTGIISLTRSLDYESQKTWNLVVTARDGGRQPALQSTCRLTINVLNLNDNEPTFVFPEKDNSTAYASTVASSKTFAVIKALDFGVDENTNLRYSFRLLAKNGNPLFENALQKVFRLNKKTGEFKFDSKTMSESDVLGVYKMRLTVNDSGTPPRMTSMTLYVRVVNTPLSETPFYDGSTGGLEDQPTMLIIIIGAAAGGVIVVFILILVLVILLRRKKKQKQRRNDSDKVSQSLSGTSSPSDEHPPPLKVRTRSSADTSLPSNGKLQEDTGFDTSSTRLTSITTQEKSCRYYEVPNSPKDVQKFMEMQSANTNPRLPPLSPTSTLPKDGKPVPGHDLDDVDMTSDMGDQCTYMCKLHGHSDTCWMPREDQPLMTQLSPLHRKLSSQWHPKPGSYRKDSGCSVDTSSSNHSYHKSSREKRHKDDVFILGDAVLPDIIAGKARTLTYSDGGSMMSSNASSGASHHSKNDYAQSPKRTQLKPLRNSVSDSRGDILRNSYITDQSTRC